MLNRVSFSVLAFYNANLTDILAATRDRTALGNFPEVIDPSLYMLPSLRGCPDEVPRVRSVGEDLAAGNPALEAMVRGEYRGAPDEIRDLVFDRPVGALEATYLEGEEQAAQVFEWFGRALVATCPERETPWASLSSIFPEVTFEDGGEDDEDEEVTPEEARAMERETEAQEFLDTYLDRGVDHVSIEVTTARGGKVTYSY